MELFFLTRNINIRNKRDVHHAPDPSMHPLHWLSNTCTPTQCPIQMERLTIRIHYFTALQQRFNIEEVILLI